jgi:hypothetical protein
VPGRVAGLWAARARQELGEEGGGKWTMRVVGGQGEEQDIEASASWSGNYHLKAWGVQQQVLNHNGMYMCVCIYIYIYIYIYI